MKNCDCKTENGYEVIGFGGKPINVNDKIEKKGYKCLSESLLWNPNPKKMSEEQLNHIRKELPEWAAGNVENFSEKDKISLSGDLSQWDNEEFMGKLEYKFSYFGKPAAEEIPVYTFKINNTSVYFPNYTDEYSVYGKKDKFGFEYFPAVQKPNYQIIENEEWIETEVKTK